MSTRFPTQVAAPAGQQAIPVHILLEATHQFAEWVKQKAQGAEVILCGGLALCQYGSARMTQDADVCMDLSRTRRNGTQMPFDTNALKDLARQDPRLVVGPKIYWIHKPTGTLVQVDFVDAQLFWHPFDVRQMVDPSNIVPSLNLPTLLAGKLKSALERNDPNPQKMWEKKSNDVSDFDFAMGLCLHRRLALTQHHLAHLGPDMQTVTFVVQEFAKLRLTLMQSYMDKNGHAGVSWWEQLIRASNLPQSLVDAARVTIATQPQASTSARK
ncbi:uncharacterized protein PHACADRAFT_190981 [Phanerochaete carnosa HHB-10118-sp]|uniref:Uncharacterized protein n=1 Tax=Phanerochaete carnosa (strain HHB-10118-sp) TaxID=650164 RepID=K5VFM1_PHACS|nr:uncharacterized protein PHACADRAFT_190981 [Phanerochaete carnosa HHB-10118-sp]EKM61791.1 hypothetical protein PHACADRAFT_190981 [Phanerochaete carnosa HHB-10118-sp]